MKKTVYIIMLLMLPAMAHSANSVMAPENFDSKTLVNREVLCTIEFAVNSTRLSADSRDILADNAERLRNIDLNKKMIRIEGFASPEGQKTRNVKLSLERAQSVERFLRVNHGVSLNSYITGYGPLLSQRITSTGSRNVEIVVYDNLWSQEGVPVEISNGQ